MISSSNFIFPVFSVILSVGSALGSPTQVGTVYIKEDHAYFVPGVSDRQNGTAVASYTDTVEKNGWATFDLSAGYATQGKTLKDQDVMFAAGYIEGYMTSGRIYQHWLNMNSSWLYGHANKSKEFFTELESFFTSQMKWTRLMVNKDAGRTPFWRHVSYVLAQFDGVYAGYNDAAKKFKHVPELSVFVFQFLNGAGDFYDVRNVIDKKNRPNYEQMSLKEFRSYIRTTGHCSALIRATGAYENIFMSHSTWFMYSSMLRVYKHYDFNLKDVATVNKQMSFSSYPGYIISIDDFYILSNGLVMLQTTNNVFDTSLYDKVMPSSLFAWQRVRVAHMMSVGGGDWGKYFSIANSGTYNNQYMIIDLKKIKLGKSIEDGALWVIEQIPTMVEYADQTRILRNGHWPSYNVPFYESIYNKSGYPKIVAQKGVEFSYQLAPRAKIFRRDAEQVVNMTQMMKLMRYNDYVHDPYSDKDPCKSVCCRGDLEANHEVLGCYDTKVTDFNMAWKRQAYAINGPSLGTGLPPFSWKAPFNESSHIGLPHTYDFDFVLTKPKF